MFAHSRPSMAGILASQWERSRPSPLNFRVRMSHPPGATMGISGRIAGTACLLSTSRRVMHRALINLIDEGLAFWPLLSVSLKRHLIHAIICWYVRNHMTSCQLMNACKNPLQET